MEKGLALTLVEIMENEGEECSLYENYSGRNMYGETTTGVVVDNALLLLTSVIAHAGKLTDQYGGNAIFEDIDNLRSDNLGNQVIIY